MFNTIEAGDSRIIVRSLWSPFKNIYNKGLTARHEV